MLRHSSDNLCVNVRDAGAVGDGVTDDSAAFGRLLAEPTANLYVPAGWYRVTRPLWFDGCSCIINGAGISSSCLIFESDSGIVAGGIDGHGAELFALSGVSLGGRRHNGMQLSGTPDKTLPATRGQFNVLEISGYAQVDLNCVKFQHGALALRLRNQLGSIRIAECRFTSFDTAIDATAIWERLDIARCDATDVDCFARIAERLPAGVLRIRDCDLASRSTAIRVNGSNRVLIARNTISNESVGAATGIELSSCGSATIFGNVLECARVMRAAAVTLDTVDNANIENNLMLGYQSEFLLSGTRTSGVDRNAIERTADGIRRHVVVDQRTNCSDNMNPSPVRRDLLSNWVR